MATTSQRQTQREKSYVMVDFLDLDTSKFSFGAAKENKYKGHMIPIKYEGKNLYVTYNRTIAPFGVGANTEMGNDKKVTGYTLSLSLGKEYENDPVFLKAKELDEFFIDQCQKNALAWHLGGTRTKPLSREAIEGYDEAGSDGKWKRIIKWSTRKNKETGEKEFLDYPPRLEINVPVTLTEDPTDENPDHMHAKFSAGFFDENGQKFVDVNDENLNEVCPPWSDVQCLASWGRMTQGSYGITMKPQAKQIKVYPREELSNDECLLGGDDGEGEADDFDGGAFGGGEVVVEQVTEVPPEDDEDDENDGDDGDDDGMVIDYGDNVDDDNDQETEPAPAKIAPRRVAPRRININRNK